MVVKRFFQNKLYCEIFTVSATVSLFIGIWFTHGTGNVGTVLCILALLWQFYLYKSFDLSDDSKKLLKIYGLWAGAALISTFYGEYPFYWISKWANFYIWCPLPFGLLLMLSRDEKVNKVCLAVAIVILAVFCALLAYEGIVYHRRAGSIINTGIMSIGSVLAVTLPMIFVSYMDERVFGRFRWLILPLFVICNLGLLYNQTRSAWIACGLMYLVSFGLYFRRNMKVTAMVLILWIGTGIFFSTNEYIRGRWTLDLNHSSNISRIHIWTSAIHIWQDNPVLGAGYMNFERLYKGKYICANPTEDEKRLTHAHNNYLMVLAEQGIVGEIFFLICYGTLLLYGVKEHKKYRDPYSLMIAVTVAGTLIHGMMECNLANPFFLRIYWTIFAWHVYSHCLWKRNLK